MFYTFADCFELNEPEDIFGYFGYSFQPQPFKLSKSDRELEGVEDLKQQLEKNLLYISLNSETARREFLIAPVLMQLINYTHARLKREYPLKITLTLNEQLQETLDYYLQSRNHLLVIKANKLDLQRGLAQLGVEMIAVDQQVASDNPMLWGAVSIGKFWQFAVLYRQEKQILQDVNLYRVPDDLEEVLRILIAILEPCN